MHTEVMHADKTILLMPCSAKKLDHADQPRRLYLGPMWQTLRTHQGKLPWRNVFVLSGKFGFIRAENFIQTYDERLTRVKADYLINGGIHTPNNHFGKANPGGPSPADVVRPYAYKDRQPFKTVISAGAGEYRRVFEAFIPQLIDDGIIAGDAVVLQVAGGIGQQRAQLGKWLRGASK